MSVGLVCQEQPSRRVRDALASFGLTIERGVPQAREVDASVMRAIREAPGASLTLITGASGGGKSTTMRALERVLKDAGERVLWIDGASLARSRRRVIELAPGDVPHAMRCLARAGLGEAGLLARRACELSEGERWRLSLARAMGDAGGGWVLGDEFCSVLDRETARGVCAAVRKWVKSSPSIRVVLASAHEDLPGMLGPDLCVRCGLDGSLRTDLGIRARDVRVTIEPGGIGDFDALSALHYRGGRPATWTRVLRAVGRAPGGDRLAGVLVESRPTLNAAWRDLPWPGRYTRGDKRARALRLNKELRCISRVIVDPRWRSMGVARRLVEAALASATTPASEAIAAMGAMSPFLERAGMRAYPAPVRAADARLEDALAHAGVEARDLIVGERADEAAGDAFVRRELTRWAQASRATRSLLGAAPGRIARAAGARLSSGAVCYAHAA